MNTADQILVVLVLYGMKLEESQAFQSLDQALQETDGKGQFFVYDNSLSQSPIPQSRWPMEYRHDPSNSGVSRAYNKAHEWAVANNFKWLLLADQDTSFPSDIFNQYRGSMESFPRCQLFAPLLIDGAGLLSPFKRRPASGKRLVNISAGLHRLNEIQAVNSGLLISVDLFGVTGGYDKKFHLDFSDFDFLDRAALKTPHLTVIHARCIHQHSDSVPTSLHAAVDRFNGYLKGSGIMAVRGNAISFRFRALARAIHLSLRHRSLQFISSFFSGRV